MCTCNMWHFQLFLVTYNVLYYYAPRRGRYDSNRTVAPSRPSLGTMIDFKDFVRF